MLQKFSFLLILCIFSQKVNAQKANPICKVLFSSIDQSYEGECKKGLAHGKGIAKGSDIFLGFPKAIQMERVFLIIMIVNHILAAFKMASVRVKAKLIF
jgi:hypothetical protein